MRSIAQLVDDCCEAVVVCYNGMAVARASRRNAVVQTPADGQRADNSQQTVLRRANDSEASRPGGM